MRCRSFLPLARALFTLSLPLALSAAGLPLGASPAAAASTTTSSNWAGYAALRPGVRFRSVSATWVVPTLTCTAGRRTYSANWVGLGGWSRTSQALEQVGTDADCASSGRAAYSAWYELLPDVAHDVRLTVRPGDTIAASVAVVGHVVRMRLVNRSRGTAVVRRVRAAAVDVSSAEWIVEAPALCTGDSSSDSACQTLPLANFGTTAFSHARVRTVGGHVGAISDPAWSTTAVSLVADAPRFAGPQAAADSAGGGQATPGALDAAGDAFGVTYREATGGGGGARAPAMGPPPG
jgi:hypothetical protein